MIQIVDTIQIGDVFFQDYQDQILIMVSITEEQIKFVFDDI